MISQAQTGPEAGHAPLPSGDPTAIPRQELERLYRDYRVRQTRALVSLMPREAVRPLYRRALASAEPSDDPMATLLAFCEELLPLPPYEVWLSDLQANPDAHWRNLEASADTPSPSTPATIDTRRFRFHDLAWNAHLRGFRDRDAWRGFIAFEETGGGPRQLHRTTLIFREDTVEDLRDRFRAFESGSLQAFLRSSLP